MYKTPTNPRNPPDKIVCTSCYGIGLDKFHGMHKFLVDIDLVKYECLDMFFKKTGAPIFEFYKNNTKGKFSN